MSAAWFEICYRHAAVGLTDDLADRFNEAERVGGSAQRVYVISRKSEGGTCAYGT